MKKRLVLAINSALSQGFALQDSLVLSIYINFISTLIIVMPLLSFKHMIQIVTSGTIISLKHKTQSE